MIHPIKRICSYILYSVQFVLSFRIVHVQHQRTKFCYFHISHYMYILECIHYLVIAACSDTLPLCSV